MSSPEHEGSQASKQLSRETAMIDAALSERRAARYFIAGNVGRNGTARLKLLWFSFYQPSRCLVSSPPATDL